MSAPAGDAEQRVQEDLYRLEAYRSQLNQLVQQHQLLTQSRAEHVRARESLEGLDRVDSGSELLIPLGADAFLRGNALPESKVLIGIGSGVVAELERPKVSELLAQRLQRLDQAAQELETQIRSLDERLQVLNQRLEEMTQTAGGSESGPTGNVGRT
ncbi:MAG TPA: prefoldin subunit alpha [Thermoplasmata archaeon]|nr:prefoldin subunit alpha [Thermoplasmata archaeon]